MCGASEMDAYAQRNRRWRERKREDVKVLTVNGYKLADVVREKGSFFSVCLYLETRAILNVHAC